MRKVLSVTLFVFLIAACTGSVEKKEEKAEDERNQLIMQYLQGIWVDDNTGLPMLKIKNDSIFLASQVNAPFCFSISGDTLQAKSSEQTTYRIVKIEEHVFLFYTSLGDLVSLHKSDTDTIPFGYQPVAKPEKKVIEKDSVFYFQGKRYRGYAYINPSTKKVLATVPDDFLQMSILSDMSFMGVDSEGYHYQATISMPDNLSCYYVNLLIDEEGVLTFKLKE